MLSRSDAMLPGDALVRYNCTGCQLVLLLLWLLLPGDVRACMGQAVTWGLHHQHWQGQAALALHAAGVDALQ